MLTRAPGGYTYVRYLPRGVAIRARGHFRIVATYPLRFAAAVIKQVSKQPRAVPIRTPKGSALYLRGHARNVYLAYRGSNFQIEVFDPTPRSARVLVASGAIRPVD